ncbi:MAG: EFR1 family ferrodoxin [Oscillospiraceae bacterium]|nr:EFR1 family ferrodoxin [Oscillospiraceae bacterium]
MILYFSGTGNSKCCAEKIASKTGSELRSINNMMREQTAEIDVGESPLLGFVSPTYDFDMAYAVAEFLNDLVIKNVSAGCYVFAVFTCGKSCGTAEDTMRSILGKKRIALNATFKVEMPDNYIPMFPLVKKDEQTRMLENADICLNSIIEDIESRKHTTIETKQMPAPMKFLIKKIAIPGQRKATKNFWVNENCISCGLCADICPKNLIRLQDGKPVWTKDDCACCLGCIHRCPKQAIQYGKKRRKQADIPTPMWTCNERATQ